MKIVCFILLVAFCVYGKAEDPKPAPAGAPAAVVPAAPTSGAAPAPAMPGIPNPAELASALNPAAKGSDKASGLVGGMTAVNAGLNSWWNTMKAFGNAMLGQA